MLSLWKEAWFNVTTISRVTLALLVASTSADPIAWHWALAVHRLALFAFYFPGMTYILADECVYTVSVPGGAWPVLYAEPEVLWGTTSTSQGHTMLLALKMFVFQFLTWVFICLREVELAKMWHRVEDPWIKYPPGRWCIVVLQTLHHPDFSRVPHYLGCLNKVWAQCFAPSILFRGCLHLGWNQDLYKCGNTPVLFEEPNRSRNFPTDLFKHCCIALWTMLLLEAGPIPLLKMGATFHQIDPSTSMSPNCKL